MQATLLGTILGPYRLDAEVGAGAMGRVYRATVVGRALGIEPGTTVALKVFHRHLLETPAFYERFLREADIGKAIDHPNVVRTYAADAVGSKGVQHNFLVMEYVEGQTLRSLLHEIKRVPEGLCRHIGLEAAKGLAAIHATAIVHRDLKPENVLITKDHFVKVMDLGVARLADEALRLSQTGAFVGSIQYAAPECFQEDVASIDGRADLHALGLVLYEMATGKNPYESDNVLQIVRRVLEERPRRLGDVMPQVSPFFEEVVDTLLAKDRDHRFATAADLVRILEEGEGSGWWETHASALRAKTGRPLRRVRIPRETALHGRQGDLDRLRAHFDRATAGEGQVVLLEGEAGIGKSRLVDEFVTRLQNEGKELNFLFGSYPPAGAATALGAFCTAYREHLGEEGLDDAVRKVLRQTPLLVPAFSALLRGDAIPTGAEPLTKDSLQTCFVHATRALAAERPTIVLVDDLHFAPEEGRSLFAALAMAVPGHRVLLVGTTRPGLDEKWIANLDRVGASRMALARLGSKDVARLLVDALHSERTAEEIAYKVILKSDGNPFFVFEILRGLREAQFLTPTGDGIWVNTKALAEIQIPSSVLDLVQARVADLAPEERDLLDVAACLGFDFDPTLLAKATGRDRIPTLKSLSRIERAHRLVRASGRRFTFDHHQVQEALYGSLPELLREEYHASIAEALETLAGAAAREPKALDGAVCVDLAEHFFKGNRAPQALRYLEPALDHLGAAYRNEAAIALSDRALAVPGLLGGKERVGILLRKAGRLDVVGRRDAQREALEEALHLADRDPGSTLRARVRYSLGVLSWRSSRHVEAQAVLGEALSLARAAGDSAEEARVTGTLGLVSHDLGSLAEAREHTERSLALVRRLGDRKGEAAAVLNLGLVCYHLGRLAEAGGHFERSLALCREIGDRRVEAIATGNLALVAWDLGRVTEGREHGERALAIAREIGDRVGEARALGKLGEQLVLLGRPVEGREKLLASREICRAVGECRIEGYVLEGLGLAAEALGEVENAERLYLEGLALRREIGFRQGIATTQLHLGQLMSDLGRVAEAPQHLSEARDVADEVGLPRVQVLARCRLALLPGGDAQDAVSAFASHEEQVRDDLSIRFALWRVTGDPTHLEAAKRLLDERILQAREEDRAAMLANVRLHREVAAAASEALRTSG